MSMDSSAVDECLDCAEQRARRLDIERELNALREVLTRSEPVTRIVERKVYTPMPPRIIKDIKYVERKVYVERPITYLRFVDVPGPAIVTERVAGRFGRWGDGLDRGWRWLLTPCCG